MDTYRCRKDNPSFSSTLLDVISRSIDERDNEVSMKDRQSSIGGCFQVDNQNPPTAGTGLEYQYSYYNLDSGGAISSSKAETIYGFPTRPRPIRTYITRNTRDMNETLCEDLQHNKANSCEGETKSRAMKIYSYLKKRGKQPISPGTRLATFLFSLFSTTNTKKSKIPSGHGEAIVHANTKPKSAPLASSFSRSCFSKKPPSSRGKVTADINRFHPASVIVNEYSQPPAVSFGRNSVNRKLTKRLAEKNRRIEESSMNIYQRKVEHVFDSIQNEDDDDDIEASSSYASSDLFELDNLSSAIEMEELPLYETTSIDAIANGLLL